MEDAAATTNLGSLDQSVTWTPKVERVDGALGLGQTASDLNPFRKKVSTVEFGLACPRVSWIHDSDGFSVVVGDPWLTCICNIVLPGIQG